MLHLQIFLQEYLQKYYLMFFQDLFFWFFREIQEFLQKFFSKDAMPRDFFLQSFGGFLLSRFWKFSINFSRNYCMNFSRGFFRQNSIHSGIFFVICFGNSCIKKSRDSSGSSSKVSSIRFLMNSFWFFFQKKSLNNSSGDYSLYFLALFIIDIFLW